MPCTAIGIIKGQKGDKGDKGDTGDKGDKGDKGDTGATGAAGVDGTTDTPSQVLSKIKNVDGSNSGLDADLLDGYDSSYFAKAEDVAASIAVKQVPVDSLHSLFRLFKSGNTVSLLIEPWEVNRDDTNTYTKTGLTIPVEYRPAYMVYIANVLPNDVRVRVKTDGSIEFFRANGAVKQFCGNATWIVQGE